MQIGSAWVKTEEKDGKKTVVNISLKLEDAILEVYPQLKNVRFSLKPNENKSQNEKAPHYRLNMYKPQEQTAAATDDAITDEDIPF